MTIGVLVAALYSQGCSAPIKFDDAFKEALTFDKYKEPETVQRKGETKEEYEKRKLEYKVYKDAPWYVRALKNIPNIPNIKF